MISVVGIDFRVASVELRERAAMTRQQVAQLLQIVAAERILRQAVILSTCNRTEFYFANDDAPSDLSHLLTHVAQIKGQEPLPADAFYRHDGLDAVRHLFRVASSLESQVVGEREIQGQVKEAYRLACRAGTPRLLLHKTMHSSFSAAKRVMTETTLGQGTASVAQAAVDLARQVFASLSGKAVMLVGAGPTAEGACQALVRAGASELVVANRTLANAQELTQRFVTWQQQENARSAAGEANDDTIVRCPALVKLLIDSPMRQPQASPGPQLRTMAMALEDIPSVIAKMDLVICSTGSDRLVIKASDLCGVLKGIDHSLLMIDISVPRNIDPNLEKLPNVYVYNIDAMEAQVARNIQRRRLEIPLAEAIVDDEAQRFGRWFASLGAVPTIKLLGQRVAELQEAQIARYRSKFSPSQREHLQEFARTLCAKILHDPISFLRNMDETDAKVDIETINILRQAFNLDGQDAEDKA